MSTQLVKSVEIQKLEAATAAGTSDIISDTIDMSGFEGCVFIIHLGTLTASHVTSVSVQESSDDSSYTDLADTDSGALADGDSDNLVVIDIHKPLLRYLQCTVNRGTQNAVINSVIGIKYGPISEPTSNGSTVFGTEAHVSPVAGTA